MGAGPIVRSAELYRDDGRVVKMKTSRKDRIVAGQSVDRSGPLPLSNSTKREA